MESSQAVSSDRGIKKYFNLTFMEMLTLWDSTVRRQRLLSVFIICLRATIKRVWIKNKNECKVEKSLKKDLWVFLCAHYSDEKEGETSQNKLCWGWRITFSSQAFYNCKYKRWFSRDFSKYHKNLWRFQRLSSIGFFIYIFLIFCILGWIYTLGFSILFQNNHFVHEKYFPERFRNIF